MASTGVSFSVQSGFSNFDNDKDQGAESAGEESQRKSEWQWEWQRPAAQEGCRQRPPSTAGNGKSNHEPVSVDVALSPERFRRGDLFSLPTRLEWPVNHHRRPRFGGHCNVCCQCGRRVCDQRPPSDTSWSIVSLHSLEHLCWALLQVAHQQVAGYHCVGTADHFGWFQLHCF